MPADIIQTIFGIILLFAGGELLIRGATSLAKSLNLSNALIGLTVVAYGTSSPEMVVSIQAAATGSPDIALGGAIGSNIANLGLVLGLVAIISPMQATTQILKRDGFILLAASIILIPFCINGEVSRGEGLMMLAALILYTIYAYKSTAKNTHTIIDEIEKKDGVFYSIAYLTVGLGLLTTGADILIDGASALASSFGVSEATIGLTIVAMGTSMPELATSLVAATRKHADMALGNIIGSSIFNMLGIIGFSAAITPMTISPEFLECDIWLMLALTVIALLMLRNKRVMTKQRAGLLVALYACYIIYQFRFITV